MLIQLRYFCSSLQQLPPTPQATRVIPTPRAAPSPPATLLPTRDTQPTPTVPLNVEWSSFPSGVLFELKFMIIKLYLCFPSLMMQWTLRYHHTYTILHLDIYICNSIVFLFRVTFVGYLMYDLPRMKILVTSEAICKWFLPMKQPWMKIIRELPYETNISLLTISHTTFNFLHVIICFQSTRLRWKPSLIAHLTIIARDGIF